VVEKIDERKLAQEKRKTKGKRKPANLKLFIEVDIFST